MNHDFAFLISLRVHLLNQLHEVEQRIISHPDNHGKGLDAVVLGATDSLHGFNSTVTQPLPLMPVPPAAVYADGTPADNNDAQKAVQVTQDPPTQVADRLVTEGDTTGHDVGGVSLNEPNPVSKHAPGNESLNAQNASAASHTLLDSLKNKASQGTATIATTATNQGTATISNS